MKLMHIIIDATYEGIPLSGGALLALAPELTRLAGMRPMGAPIVCGETHPWGPSLLVPWQESHASIHYMGQHAVSIDLFSCREFDDRGLLVWLWPRLSLRTLLAYRLLWRLSSLPEGAPLPVAG
ncbi:MAG TPA: hypothetical protein VJA25_01340 [Dehalococcoidia bacterium]|nr:hypothetical protein [Dehalococcoidia bacterium]